MIAEGATTLWERWEKLAGMGMNSHNHIMFGSVDAWFYRGAAGIIPLEPAWRSVLVAPKTVGGLAHAAATQATPRGPISASWSRSPWLLGDGVKARDAGADGRGGEFRLSVSIPDGTAARIVLPYADRARALTESGRTVCCGGAAAAGGPAAAGAPVSPLSALPEGLARIERRGAVFEIEAGSGDYEFALSW
jgi:alpha-L-rhamnosidase